jgi:predicted RNase H-like HicB family nuclease
MAPESLNDERRADMREQSTELELTIVYTDDENGWSTAEIPALPGTITAGKTRDEARTNVLDALRTMLSTPADRDLGGNEVERLRVRLDVARSSERSLER